MRSVQKVVSHAIWKIDIYWRRYKIQETLYIGQWHFSSLQNRHLGTSHSSQLSLAAPSYFSESHWWFKISFLSKLILISEKTRSDRVPNLGCRGVESPGWFDVSPKSSAQKLLMHELVHCCDKAANHQLLIAAAFWFIWMVNAEDCSSLTQNLMQIRCSTHSVILNAIATQYTCSLNDDYCPHWLVQWSHHCSHMCIPVHSPWLPGYTVVGQTTFVISTMAGHFPDRPRSFP